MLAKLLLHVALTENTVDALNSKFNLIIKCLKRLAR